MKTKRRGIVEQNTSRRKPRSDGCGQIHFLKFNPELSSHFFFTHFQKNPEQKKHTRAFCFCISFLWSRP